MPKFTAKDVQALRQLTGAGMMDAKRAMEANDGNSEEAAKWLREQGLGGVAKRAEREAGEGLVALAVTDSAGAIVELRCETDFVAKSPELVGLAEELAALVAKSGEQATKERDSELDNLRTTLKENNLVVREELMVCTARLIANPVAHKLKAARIDELLERLRGLSTAGAPGAT